MMKTQTRVKSKTRAKAKTPAKKTPAKKTPPKAKKTPAKKTPAKKTPAKKTPTKSKAKIAADEATLAALLAKPSESNWKALCKLLEGWPASSVEAVVRRAREGLRAWPSVLLCTFDAKGSYRPAPERWCDALSDGKTLPPAWGVVEYVQYYRCGLEAHEAAHFLGRPELAGIQRLGLQQNNLSADVIADICTSPCAPSLRLLNLHSNPIGPLGASALAKAEQLAQLRNLCLHNCQLGLAGTKYLLASTALAGLEHLDLRYSWVAEESYIDALTQATGLPSIVEIKSGLGNGTFTEDVPAEVIARLAEAPERFRRAYFAGKTTVCLRAIGKLLGVRGLSRKRRAELSEALCQAIV